MEGVQGGSPRQFQSVQTQTENTSEVGKSHTHGSMRKVEVQPTPGLTEPGNVKHTSIKTRIMNAWKNNWNPISDGVKDKIVGNVGDPDTKSKVSAYIDTHNGHVEKLTTLKQEKGILEEEVKSLQGNEDFKKMVDIVTKGSFSKNDIKKGKTLVRQGEDGKLEVKSFKHNNTVVNSTEMSRAIESFKNSSEFLEYTKKLDRIKDITQERAEIKENLRYDGKQTAADLKADAKNHHKEIRERLRDVKGLELKNAREQFTTSTKKTKGDYEKLKQDIKEQKQKVEGEIKELRVQREEARSKVRGGLADKWSNWHKKNIGALVSRIAPKGVEVNQSALKKEWEGIKADLAMNRETANNLGKKIDDNKKTRNDLDSARNDFRKGRDDELKGAKKEKESQKSKASSDYERNKHEVEVRYDEVKHDNKDLAKVLKGKKNKSGKK